MSNYQYLGNTSSSTMSAAVPAVFLLCCLLTGAVGAELPPPQDVIVWALNTNYVLKWGWNESAAEGQNVTFTTQYIPKFKLKYKASNKKRLTWHMVCEETSQRSCDLTECNLHHLGIYVIRVRANVNGNHSDWMQREFCPDKDGNVGPPSKVDLSPAGSDLDVFITDPLTNTNTSIKTKFTGLYYYIVYWERSDGAQPSRIQSLKTSANMVTLPDLRSWTWYCVKVQARDDYYNKNSTFSRPHCMQTNGQTPWWQIFLYFLASLVVFFIAALVIIYCFFRTYKTVQTTFFPSNQLPPHLMEYLCRSPGSDIPRLISPDSESELLCNKAIICPEPVLEIHYPPAEALPEPPSGLEPYSSGRHSRHDSRGSRDSGVYSTGGSSGLGQPSSNQSSTGAETSWQGPFDLEQMKMQDMVPGLKTQPLIADEGIGDMCV